MKKLLLLLLTSVMLLAASCSSDDNNEEIIYDEVKGYLTNLESVKHGLQGSWEDVVLIQNPDRSYELRFSKNTVYSVYKQSDNNDEKRTEPYSVLLENGKFYFESTIGNGNTMEIYTLNRTSLIFYDEEYDRLETYSRK